MDVNGVQDLFYEADLALDAITRMKAGETLPALLLDPGFVIRQENLEQDREKMWGYIVWKAANG